MQMIKQRLLEKRGFTLVEVIIVMLILSVVMTAVMSLIVPAQRSSIIQSDLSTVQGGMRVALERMTKDFRNAGFLIAGASITSAGYILESPPVVNDVVIDASVNSVTVNTRAVSGAFGRVASIPTATSNSIVTPPLPSESFSLIYQDQFRNFPTGSYAAVIEPVSGDPIGDIYYVMSSSPGLVKLGNKDTHGALADVGAFAVSQAGLILLPVPSASVQTIKDAADPVAATKSALSRTITYDFVDTDNPVDGIPDTLTRQVDVGKLSEGNRSYLARGVTALTFTVQEDGDGDASKVIIDLVGQSIGLGNDTVSSEKTQQSRITVSLRNF